MPNYEPNVIERLSSIHDEQLAEIAGSEIARDLFDEILDNAKIDIDPRVLLDSAELTLRQPGPETAPARRHRNPVSRGRRVRILAAMMVTAAAVFALVALTSNGTPLLFPRGASDTALGTAPQPHRAWHLTGVISHQALSEGGLPSAATSNLSCPTESQCYAVSNPPITRLDSVPDYLLDLGSGAVDVSSDAGTNWTSEPLPTGVVLTTPLVCQGSSDCTAGAVLLQQPQTLAQVAPQDMSTQIASLLGSNGQATPANCGVDGSVGALSEDQTLAALADFGDIASAVLKAPTTNSCASTIASQVLFTVAYAGSSLLGPEGLPALLGGNSVLSSTSLDSVEQSLQSMTLYGTATATAALESTTDGGATWSTVALPSGAGPLLSLTCPTSSTCMGIALTTMALTDELPWMVTPSRGNVEPVEFVETTDDGESWTASNFPTSADAPYSLTCLDTTTCLAVGSVISTNAGIS
jgi:hypothetical protein